MAIISLKPLQGLKGLSQQEQDAYKQKVISMGILSENSAFTNFDRLYKNDQFINTFGKEAFDRLNAEDRDNMYFEHVVPQMFADAYKDDADFSLLTSELDAQGMYDLMTNENYLGTAERKKRLQEGIKASERVVESYNAAIDNPYTDALGAGFMQFGKTKAALSPYEQDKEYEQSDKEIQEKLFAEAKERREEKLKPVADAIYNSFLEADATGQKSLADQYADFERLANDKDVSPHYATFEDGKWLSDYSYTDKLKDYAMYQAIASQYGEGTARQYLDRTIQNRVADAQDGKPTWNTGKKIFTTIWSDLGSNIGMTAYLGRSAEEIGLLNQGLDPDKPKFNDKGEIIGYELNDSMWRNPAYWSDVYKYNTFSPDEIQAIKERGGISEDVNVRRYGHVPEFWSWETVQEAAAQAGHIAAFGIESGLMGGTGKLAGWAAKKALTSLGVGAETMAKLSKVGKITNDMFVALSSGATESQQEAMGTFEESLQRDREAIEQQKKAELREYYNSIDFESPESQSAIDAYYQALKKQDQERVAANANSERGEVTLPLDDEILKQQAKQQYTNELLNAKVQELEDLHKKDELAASKAAAIGYGTTLVMDMVKNAPFDLLLQKFKFAKGSTTGAFDNTISKNIIGDIESGGIKRVGKKLASAKNVSKEYGKLIAGGFADEYMDGLNSSFGEGVNSNEFDNYINRTYNPESYNEAVDTFLGNILSGMTSEINGVTDWDNVYEGLIGMISPGVSVMVNPNMVYNPKSTWQAIVQGIDENGAKLDIAERISRITSNPLLNTYADLRGKDRVIDNTVEMINGIVSKNKDKLENASQLLYALDRYDSPLRNVRYNVGDEGEDITVSMLDSKDEKLHNAFALINTLSTLGSVQGGEKSPLYTQALETMQGLAEGRLSEENMKDEIDSFLADPDNKSILDKGPETARQIATERLQKNAKYFMDMKQRYDELTEMFGTTPSMKNVDPRVQNVLKYNLIARDDYENRLKELEETSNVSHTNTESAYTPDYSVRYGTQKARENAVAARERSIRRAQEEQALLEESIAATKEKIESLKKGKEAIDNPKEEIAKKENLLKSYNLHLDKLKDDIETFKEEVKAISSISPETETELTEESILGLDARDRAAVLEPENRENYSRAQRKVIDHVTKKLNKQNVFQKVQDAGILAQRIEDLDNLYDKISSNSELAAEYLNAVEFRRTQNALAESVQRDIDKHYKDIEKAYDRYAKSANTKVVQGGKKQANIQPLKNTLLKLSPMVVGAYMEDHPDQAPVIQPIHDLLSFVRDANGVIQSSELSKEVGEQMVTTLVQMLPQVNTKEDAIKYLEGIIDSSDISTEVKNQYDDLLTKLNNLGYQRDAIVVENRKQQREREEATRKQEEERQKKLNEAREAAATKAIQEEKKEKEGKVDAQFAKGLSEQPAPDANEPVIEGFEHLKPKDNISETPKSSQETQEPEATQNKTESPAVNNDMVQVIKDNQGNDMAVSPTLEQQALTVPAEGGETLLDNTLLEDSSEANDKIGRLNETKDNTISSNALIPWKVYPKEIDTEGKTKEQIDQEESEARKESLKYGGKLIHKHGDPNPKSNYVVFPDGTKADTMDRYFRWMEKTMQTNLQNIIDLELSQIIAANPNMKIQFMGVGGAYKSSDADVLDDKGMYSKLLLVTEYNDRANPKITSIHSDENGGVIEALDRNGNPKKYLIIGVAGYGKDNASNVNRKALYDSLYDNREGFHNQARIRVEMDDFFAKHPKERFYVSPTFETEEVPFSLTPGWVVNQLETDDHIEKNRKVSDLLFDKKGNTNKERNPEGLKWRDLSWGIQKADKLLPVRGRRYTKRGYMRVQKDVARQGNLFLMIPAGNGKLMPAYINPLFYKEMLDGSLKGKVTDLIIELSSAVQEGQNAHDVRLNYIRSLAKIFYFSDIGNNLLLSKDGNTITFTAGNDGINSQIGYVNLSAENARDELFRLFTELNPRVNITAEVLMDEDALKEYDEAGALTTDLALLHTVGSTYSVWGIGQDGKMLKPAELKKPVWNGINDRLDDRTDIPYNGKKYSYNNRTNQYQDENGNVIEDSTLKGELKYNMEAAAGNLDLVLSRGKNSFYLLSQEPLRIIRINESTKKVTHLSEEEAQKIMDQIEKDKKSKEEKERKQLAQDAIAQEKKAAQGIEEEERSNPNENLDNLEDVLEKEEQGEGESQPNQAPVLPKKDKSVEYKPYKATSPTQTFRQLVKKRTLTGENAELGLSSKGIYGLIKEVFEDAPIEFDEKGKPTKGTVSELEAFLKKKGEEIGMPIESDAIGTSNEDIKVWLDTLKNCRK